MREGVGDTWDSRAELAGREGLALLFLVQEAVDQIATTGRPAPIAGLALSFLVQEAGLEQR